MLRCVSTSAFVYALTNKLVVSVKSLKSAGIVGAPVKEPYAPSNNVGVLVKLL